MTVLLLVVGLACLTLGAEVLVRGASAIATRLGLDQLVIGLTVVAFGTSAPEVAVSLKAALAGQGSIAIGNIVGSNIFNVAAILGLAAIVRPLVVHSNILRRDMPVMLAVCALFVALLATGAGLSRPEGIALLVLLLVHTTWAVRAGRVDAALAGAAPIAGGSAMKAPARPLILDAGFVVVGLALLIFGSRLFVDNASDIARAAGWSEAAIGLTIVAAGTSMPELATSLIAVLRRQTDIAIGNIVGSSIFNVLCIGGLASTVRPLERGGVGLIDFVAMLATALLLLPLMRTGLRIQRWEGLALLAAYAGYVWLLWP